LAFLRVEAQRLSIGGLRLGMEPLGEQHAAQPAVRSRAVGLDTDGGAEGLRGLPLAPLLAQHLAEIDMRLRVARLEAHRLAEGAFGGRVLPLEVEHDTEPPLERG